MAKQNRGLKLSGERKELEHYEQIDDNSLPIASEVEKFAQIDPSFIPWIQQYMNQEQSDRREARKEFTEIERSKLQLTENTNRKLYKLDMWSLNLAAIVLLSGMVLSGLMIVYGMTTTGTIFSGVTLAYAASSFLNFRKQKAAKIPKEN